MHDWNYCIKYDIVVENSSGAQRIVRDKYNICNFLIMDLEVIKRPVKHRALT